jgi:hypothetical protein
MANDHTPPPGPFHVWITIEYEYAGRKYLTKQYVDSENKIGPDVIFLNVEVMKEIKKLWKPNSRLTMQKADGSRWDTASNKLNAPVDFGPASSRLVDTHTPICWHEPGCTFWCADS